LEANYNIFALGVQLLGLKVGGQMQKKLHLACFATFKLGVGSQAQKNLHSTNLVAFELGVRKFQHVPKQKNLCLASHGSFEQLV
jgi:hypothetical protein